MPQVLFICSGNTCRSPVAAAILSERLKKEGICGWLISSAGIDAIEGQEAAQYSKMLMKECGIDLSLHRSHVLDFKGVMSTDLILCMSQEHVSVICSQYPNYCGKVYRLSEMIGEQFDILDPFGGSYQDYFGMVVEISRIIEIGMEKVVALAKKNDNF
jgi:protein-tyrosine-phosphatase